MARSSSAGAAVVVLLLAGLAVTATATSTQRRSRHSEVVVSQLDGSQEEAGLYDCPDLPKMKACAPTGCALHTHRKASYLICNQCRDDQAYVLVNAGTRKASCDCAPGFAGRGQDGVCRQCPAGTHVAAGGPIRTSTCLRCPKGTIVSDDGSDCVCPAGHYRAPSDQPAGFMRVACKACEARSAYVSDDMHSKDSCSSCKTGMLANKDHTECVPANSPDAADLPAGLLKAVDSTFGGLASAFEEGRQAGQEQRLMRMAGEGGRVPEKLRPSFEKVKPAAPEGRAASVFKQLGQRVSSLRATVEERLAGKPVASGGKRAEQDKVDDDEEYARAAEEDVREQGTPRAEDEDEETEEEAEAESEQDALSADEAKLLRARGGYEGKHSSSKKKHSGASKDEDEGEEEEEEEEEKEEHTATKGYRKHRSTRYDVEKEKDKEGYGSSKHSKKDEDNEDKEGYGSSKHSKKDEDKGDKEGYGSSKHSKKDGDKEEVHKTTKRSKKEEDKEEEEPEEDSKKGDRYASAKQQKREERREAHKEAVADKREARAEVKSEAQPDKVAPNLAQQLIPNLPVEPQPATPNQDADNLTKQKSIRDMAKQLGSQLGAVAPSRDYIGGIFGKIDPDALADAGLPPVSNVGGLMGAIIKRQFGDLDTSEMTNIKDLWKPTRR